mgnify:CR=1 FL=1
MFKQQREQELNEDRQKLEEIRFREEVIRQEKERLLREHLPNIEGFLPKGILTKPEDTKYLTKQKF